MLNPKLPDLFDLRTSFLKATPFKHLCIDEFLIPSLAEQLYIAFPKSCASKDVSASSLSSSTLIHEDIRTLGSAYVALDDYFSSSQFLATISEITGIPDLLYDPSYSGAGAVEAPNLEEIDPYIDSNYDRSGELHRRLKAVIFLNKDWNEDWGGQLQIHSNPQTPEKDTTISFAPSFNRCIILETTESSWHGFPRINLPPEKRALSRKSLHIYFYSRARPVEETAPHHRDRSAPRPLPPSFISSPNISEACKLEICSLVKRRDTLIQMYQELELSLNREIESLRRTNSEIVAASKVPCVGYITQVGRATNFFADGWVGKNCKVTFVAHKAITGLELTLSRPSPQNNSATISAHVNQNLSQQISLAAGVHVTVSLPLRCRPKEQFELSLIGPSFSPKELHINEDERELLCKVHLIMALHD